MLKRWAVAASIGLLVAAGNGVAQEGDKGAVQAGQPGAGPVVEPAGQPEVGRAIHFDLEHVKGKVTQDAFPGKYLLLAIGYSSCPDICPTTLFEFGEVMQALKNPDAIVPVFVTIDPVNDSAERLDQYVRFFDERIVGLTGSMKNIRALADILGATFGYRLDGKKLEKPEPGVPYSVYHSALIYLIGPDRKLADVYDYQMGPEGLTQELDRVLGEPPKDAGKKPDADQSDAVKPDAEKSGAAGSDAKMDAEKSDAASSDAEKSDADKTEGKAAVEGGTPAESTAPAEGGASTEGAAPAEGSAPAKSDAPAKAEEASVAPAGEMSASVSGHGGLVSAGVCIQASV